MFIFIDDLKVVSESNAHEHFRAKDRRARAQRDRVTLALRQERAASQFRPPCRITLTRVAPREMDDDNLQRAFKRIRDTVCSELLPHNRANQKRTWADDSDGQIEWKYGQRKGETKQYAVEIEVEVIG